MHRMGVEEDMQVEVILASMQKEAKIFSCGLQDVPADGENMWAMLDERFGLDEGNMWREF